MFRPEAKAATLQDLEHLWTFAAAGIPLDVTASTLTFDEAYTPHVMLRAMTVSPSTQAALDELDPLLRVRVAVSAGYRYPNGTQDLEPMADLLLDAREVARPSNTMALNAQSNERLLIDQGTGLGSLVFDSSKEAYNAIVDIVQTAIPGAPTNDIGLRAYGLIPADDPLKIYPGDNAMEAILDLQDRAGDWWVYDDGLGVWNIRRRPELAAVPFLDLRVGEGGNVIDSRTSRNRDGWYNAVKRVHTWRTAAGVDKRVEATVWIGSGPYDVAQVGAKVYLDQRSTPATQATANEGARSMLRRMVSRGHGLTIEALAYYGLRPGHTVRVRLPLGGDELHLVAAVHFEHPSGIMTVETRRPIGATISTGA